MNNQQYSQEFKDAAVRPVIDGGAPLLKFLTTLGVSQHSLYKWIKKWPTPILRSKRMVS